MKYLTRPATIEAALAVAVSTLIALVLQLGLLGALGSAVTARNLTLAPIANVESAKAGDALTLRFDTTRGPAVAQARAIQVAARDVLAITFQASEVSGDVRGIFGWLSTRDLNRATSVPMPLAAGTESRTTTLLLSGHPRWRDTLTQVGLGLDGARGQPGGALVTEFELIPAHPLGAMRLLAQSWFEHDVNVVKPAESANRVLPLALWFVLICALSVAILVLAYRRIPAQRAAALQAAIALLGVLAIVLTILGRQWPGGPETLIAAIAAIAALWLIEPLPRLPLTRSKRWLIVAALAALCVAASPWVAAVSSVPAVLLLLNQWRPGIWASGAVALLALPLLVVCAIAQKLVPGPAFMATLIDPTSTLAGVATSSAGLPGFAVGLLMAHHFWPAPAQTVRWSGAAAVAAAWAFAGALAVPALPSIAALGADKATLVALFLPFLACLLLAVRPKFHEVAATIEETAQVQARSEDDLSANALTLLESHAERVRNTLARGETGAARAAVTHMYEIAAAARSTAFADLQVSLATNDLAGATRAGDALLAKALPSPTSVEADALLDLAHRQNNPQRVVELAAISSRSERNTRALAMAKLRLEGPAQALTTLSAWPDEATFAREIAELHLLGDNVPAAQQAMVNTGIALTDPVGQAYVARIGLRVQGATEAVRGIGQLAIWHPQVGAAQAAQGELLLRQGNPGGARARFLLAIKLDPYLWALQQQVLRIDAQTGADSI